MIHGVVGEFLRPEDIIDAARRLYANGFRRFDAFTPAPIEELDALLAPRRGRVLVLVMAAAGMLGLMLALFMQYYGAALSYPLNVGGRPLASWPAFVPIAWEIAALCTVFAGFGAFLLACGLPRLHHPIFAVAGFERASQDRFFLCVEASEPRFDAARIGWIFERYGAVRVSEVPA